MKLKTFTTHTLAMITSAKAIELSFNVWATENNVEIIRTDYFINKRRNKFGDDYEDLTLFIFYKNI